MQAAGGFGGLDAAVASDEALGVGVFEKDDAGRESGCAEGGHERVHVDVGGDVAADSAERGGDAGKESARGGLVEQFHGWAGEAGPIGPLSAGGVDLARGAGGGIGGGQEFETAGLLQGDGDGGGLLKFAEEFRKGTEAGAVPLLEGTGGERAGRPEGAQGGGGGAGAAGALFQERDAGAALGKSPCTGESDRAAADDENVHAGAILGRWGGLYRGRKGCAGQRSRGVFAEKGGGADTEAGAGSGVISTFENRRKCRV